MERINFRQERDFGTVLQDSSVFIKLHFLRIIKPILAVIAIPILIGVVFSMINIEETDRATKIIFPVLSFVADVMVNLSSLAAYMMVIAYVKLYVEGKETIQWQDLTDIIRVKITPIILGSILLGIITYLGLILCLLPGVYLSVVFAHFYVILIIEDKVFKESWDRSFFLIRDHWWPSFGLYLVTLIILGSIYLMLYSPIIGTVWAAMRSLNTASSIGVLDAMSAFVYLAPVYQLIDVALILIFTVISCMKYYSLVELKDGSGERELINQLS